MNILTQGGGRIVKEDATAVDGITNVYYEIPRLNREGKVDGSYKSINSPKTVYDPKKFSDEQILKWGQEATAKGYERLISSNKTQDYEIHNGIKFRFYLNKETKGINNVHPE